MGSRSAFFFTFLNQSQGWKRPLPLARLSAQLRRCMLCVILGLFTYSVSPVVATQDAASGKYLVDIAKSGNVPIAQSTYRFKVKPDFMLLTIYPNSRLRGYTASAFDRVDGYKTLVIGSFVTSEMILAFYPTSVALKE